MVFREINVIELENTVRRLFMQACISPREDVLNAFREANETSETGRELLRQILENYEIAKADSVPGCQDTGMAVVFCDIGQDVHLIGGDIMDAVNNGVRRAYKDASLRNSVLNTLTRENTGDNTPAVLHVRLVPGDRITVHALPKGFGSENMSKIAMLTPSQGLSAALDFIVDTAKAASSNPCPPVVLGIGIGGTFEYAALASKRELLRPCGQPSTDPAAAKLEREIKDRINALKIGPMGMGGDTYCLAAHVHVYPTHISAFPVAVNYCCHALRCATEVI